MTRPIDLHTLRRWSGKRLVARLRRSIPVAWLVLLSGGLALFLWWMPLPVRLLIGRALVDRGLPSSMLLVFSLLAVSLVWSAGQRVDVWAFLFFNLRGSRPLWLDRAMLAFTQIGSGAAALVIGVVAYSEGDHIITYELILGTLTLWMMVELLKAVVRRPRPFIHVTQARIVGSRAPGRSFPSGHTSQVFFVATLLVQHFHPNVWLASGLYAVAALVGITRLYVGAHYPRDVLAGAILGSVWGLLGVLVDDYIMGGGVFRV